MRIPGWLFIVGALFGVMLTALCAFVAFIGTQRFVVDLGRQGVYVDSPAELAQAVLQPGSIATQQAASFSDFVAAQPTATRTPVPLPQLATNTPAAGSALIPTLTPIAPTATVDPLAGYTWEDPRRFNVLLLGIDQRSGVEDNEEYFRTDTIMVVSIDPVRKRAGVLSIPRDLWVSIPGFTEQRINTANALGDSNNYPGGGGPALAAETVRANLGIEVDRYVLINFDVFTTVVDLIAPDGIEVCINEVIDDPDYPDAGYGTIEVYFEPGCQALDSEKLLQYARTRATQGGDFDRARRQQQVIEAVRQHVLSAGGITNFVAQVPALWEELSGSYRTNMSLEEILSLAALVQEFESEDLSFGVINNMHVQFAATSSGDQVLLPNYGAIRQLIQQTFNPQELSEADLLARAEQEAARIVVYNNTEIAGLAGSTREWLISQGVTIESVGNITEPTSADTIIRLYTGKTWTARYLAELLGLSQDRIIASSDGLTSADIMIVVGPDIQPLLTSGD
jgi:LCP family protein required for cell wall assembly